MKHKVLKELSAALILVAIAGIAHATPIPSFNMTGTIGNGQVYDTVGTPWEGDLEWNDISGLYFTAQLTYSGEPAILIGDTTYYAYLFDISIPDYTFNRSGDDFYDEAISQNGIQLFINTTAAGTEYQLVADSLANMTSEYTANFFANGTGNIEGIWGDDGMYHIGTFQLQDTDFCYTVTTPVPVPAPIFLLGTGLAGLLGVQRRSKK